MKTNFYAFFLPVILLFSACSKSVDIQFPSKFVKENEVIINNKLNLKDLAGENAYSSFTIENGEIMVSINGQSKTIETSKGGILNLEKSEFVIFPVYYRMGEESFPTSQGLPRPIMIDSMIVYNKKMLRGSKEEEIIEVASKNNGPYIAEKVNMFELTKVNKSEFFIEKNWEINITDEIPDEISVSVSSETQSASVSKYAIKPASEFLVMALFTGEYSIINLREK